MSLPTPGVGGPTVTFGSTPGKERPASAAAPTPKQPPALAEWYEGEWRRGLRHGRGTAHYTSGECYVGEWVDGERKGVGSLAHKPGARLVQPVTMRGLTGSL